MCTGSMDGGVGCIPMLHYIKSHQQQTSTSSSSSSSCSSEAMTSLLTLLGAVLCSLTVSSEVLPQADFNIHEVRGRVSFVYVHAAILYVWWWKEQHGTIYSIVAQMNCKNNFINLTCISLLVCDSCPYHQLIGIMMVRFKKMFFLKSVTHF